MSRSWYYARNKPRKQRMKGTGDRRRVYEKMKDIKNEHPFWDIDV